MPAFPKGPTTWQQMRQRLCVAGANRRDMDNVVRDDSLDRRAASVSPDVYSIRCEARFNAISWIESAAGNCRTIHRLIEEAKVVIPCMTSGYTDQQRSEYKNEFLWEVQSRVDAMIGMRAS